MFLHFLSSGVINKAPPSADGATSLQGGRVDRHNGIAILSHRGVSPCSSSEFGIPATDGLFKLQPLWDPVGEETTS
jgi:hypothetical protein